MSDRSDEDRMSYVVLRQLWKVRMGDGVVVVGEVEVVNGNVHKFHLAKDSKRALNRIGSRKI